MPLSVSLDSLFQFHIKLVYIFDFDLCITPRLVGVPPRLPGFNNGVSKNGPKGWDEEACPKGHF